MKTRQLNLEISESLYQQLERLAELTEESIDDLAISMIAKDIFASLQNAQDFKKKIDSFSTDEIPEIVDHGELTGVEVF